MTQSNAELANALKSRFLWASIACLYGIWVAVLAAMLLAPSFERGPDARALTGLAETHQAPRSQESVVLRQTRRR